MKFNRNNTVIEISATKNHTKNLIVLFSFEDKLLKESAEYSESQMFSQFDNNSEKANCIAHYNSTTPNIVVNLGKKDKFTLNIYLNLLADLSNTIKHNDKIKTIDLVMEETIATALKFDFNHYVEQTTFNLVQNFYQFDDFKSNKTKTSLQNINIISKKNINPAINSAIILLEGLFLVKNLGNNPANVATPKYFAKIANKIAKESKKVTIKIIDEKEAAKLKMFSFLAVGQGSVEESQMITMSYSGGKTTDKPIVLVGKGVTFDSGGISIKPSAHMETMKYDMMGAATVLGAFISAVKLELPINLVMITPCTENLPSGSAVKPGDIVKSMSGKTIEIVNTDAEGRLILCDALTYAKKYKPAIVIDIATLTGACVMALGNVSSGMYSNDDNLAQSLNNSAMRVNDKIWRMPLFDEYLEPLKSSIADLSNLAGWGTGGGSVTAAKFLECFTDYKWAHLDIAGTAYKGGYNGTNTTGATGRPFYLIMDFLRNYKSA